MLAGVALSVLARTGPITDPEKPYVSWAILGLVLFWVGAFVLCYPGCQPPGRPCFPIAFLLFMVPLRRRSSTGSSASCSRRRPSRRTASSPLGRAGLPGGLLLRAPGLAIEVAEECSGIRSFLALTITAVLAGQVLLRTGGPRRPGPCDPPDRHRQERGPDRGALAPRHPRRPELHHRKRRPPSWGSRSSSSHC